MKFYGEILVIILLLLANGRILFIKNAKKDSLYAQSSGFYSFSNSADKLGF